jgi:hypothetical protein
MSESLKRLLDLQEVDLARDRLAERLAKLPERAELTEHERRMDEVRAAIARVDKEIEAVVKEITNQEGELALIEQKITREEARLYGGEVVNPKELSALQSEIAMFKRQKTPLEEGALERMMQRDELYGERERLETELSDLGKEADELRGRIAEATGEIEGLMDEEESKRKEHLSDLPEDVVELYEELRESKRGIGAGALQNGVCTACREALSAVEVDRIKQAARLGETRFRCEHCRRILVVG